MRSFAILSLAGAALAATSGFNYGATNSDGSARQQADFEAQMNRAKSLQGTSGFNSARLYTMIQSGTTDTVISAIPAAIASKTSLLLGLWASQPQDGFNNELTALKNAISQYGSDFTSLISGISVGSEDLYRETPTGIANKAGVGASPDQLVSYIKQVRDTISGTGASGAKVGHVDTWTAWVNGSNVEVIDNCDFLGVDGYPYFQTVNANGIENGESLFFQSYNATVGVAQGKDVWVTETGWPVSGPNSGQAVASTANAETYWKDVACKLLGNVNTYWYTLYDPETSGPSFSLVGPNLDSAPLYDLSCSGVSSSSSSSAASSSASKSTPAVSAGPTVNGVHNGANGGVQPQSSFTGGGESPKNSQVPQPGSNGGAIHSSEGPDGVMTMYSTTMVTISACGAEETGKPPVSQPSTPAQSGSGSTGKGSGSSNSTGSSSGACPAALGSAYQYPHLIVPVDSANANKAYGTSYNATLSSTVSTIFNYDIPSSYVSKTCSLYFFFPQQKDLETTAFTFNGKGGISVSELNNVATQSTSYSSIGASKPVKSIDSVAPGNSYLIASGPCKEGAYSYEFSATGGLELNYFQDYNPSALGAFITSC